MPAGEYSLVVHGEIAPEAGAAVVDRITLATAPAPFSNLLLCWLLLAVWPVYVLFRSSSFETARWAWSDHPRSSRDEDD